MATTITTRSLEVPDVTLTYNASGFATLASYFPDRTVLTYDPRA